MSSVESHGLGRALEHELGDTSGLGSSSSKSHGLVRALEFERFDRSVLDPCSSESDELGSGLGFEVGDGSGGWIRVRASPMGSGADWGSRSAVGRGWIRVRARPMSSGAGKGSRSAMVGVGFVPNPGSTSHFGWPMSRHATVGVITFGLPRPCRGRRSTPVRRRNVTSGRRRSGYPLVRHCVGQDLAGRVGSSSRPVGQGRCRAPVDACLPGGACVGRLNEKLGGVLPGRPKLRANRKRPLG